MLTLQPEPNCEKAPTLLLPRQLLLGSFRVCVCRWLDQCDWSHDDKADRRTRSSKTGYVGQNLAQYTSSGYDSTPELTRMVDLWYNEIRDMRVENVHPWVTAGNTGVTGHLTQEIWSGTTKVGCGFMQFVTADGAYTQVGGGQSVHAKGFSINSFFSFLRSGCTATITRAATSKVEMCTFEHLKRGKTMIDAIRTKISEIKSCDSSFTRGGSDTVASRRRINFSRCNLPRSLKTFFPVSPLNFGGGTACQDPYEKERSPFRAIKNCTAKQDIQK